MAEVAVSFVVERLADILDQIEEQKGVRKEVERLQDELKRMRCFLRDADAKQEDDERVCNWVSDIRNVAYDAEDLIDTFILKIDSLKKKHFIKRYTSITKEWKCRSKIRKDLEGIQLRIRDISASRETYGIQNLGVATSSASEKLRKLRRSSPRGEERDIVGLEDNISGLVARLVDGDRWRAISIVGMGGIGKTTLAKKVYNHGNVQAHFPSRAWIYLSQEFRTRDIMQAIIKHVASPRTKLEDLLDEELEEMLYEHLKRKRYLVVLDDIWSTTAWDYLAKAFPNRHNGSRVMLTTRNKNVALHADAQTVPYNLQFLSKENSWELFCKKAFIDSTDAYCSPQLEEIGKEIVGKCAGLPLAIIVIGGLLSRKRKLGEWERVLNNMHSFFARDPTGVSAILALSYNDLPYYLKSCFLYLGHFPEDYLIPTHKLFRLWIAEGLIPHQGERMEDIAEDYLNELIERNMVQMARISVNDRVKQCRMHDLLRDLSVSKAKTQNFLEIEGNQCSMPSTRCRRHAIYSGSYLASLKHSNPHLRSLLFFRVHNQSHNSYYSRYSYGVSDSDLDQIGGSFKLLRVLELEGITCTTIPSTIGELIHLKYLGLKRTNLCMISSAIGSLRKLQTLNIAENLHLTIVPNVIYKMSNLRHLYMCGHKYGGCLKIDTLQHLQTLSEIHVDRWQQNKSANLTSLRKLKIRGNFSSNVTEIFKSIVALGQLQSLYLHTEDAEFPSVTQLSSLHRLTKLHMSGGIRELPSLQEFPPNLSHLTLEANRLNQDQMEIIEKLPKLLILRLKAHSYSGEKLAISENGFPQLEFLELNFLADLEDLNVEEGAMQRLRTFRIVNCRKLKMLPEEIKSVTTLRELEVEEMPKVFVDKLQGEDFHKVQHVPAIIFI